MTWLLQFTFWFAIGAIAAGASITLSLISAVRRVELFPAVTGAAVVPAVLLLITVRCIAWAQAPKRRHNAVETITFDEPALHVIEVR